MEEEPNNVLDYFDEELTLFFSLDDKKIKSLIDAINKYGSNLSLMNVEQATGLSSGDGTAGQIRGMISNIAHHNYYHKDDLEKDFQSTKLQKENVPKLKEFLQKLNENAITGLNTRFEVNRSLGEYTLSEIGNEVYLKEILDDNDVFLGYLPLMRVFLKLRDGENDLEETKRFDVELDKFISIMKSFEKMRDDFIKSATRYKNKLGDSLILQQDD